MRKIWKEIITSLLIIFLLFSVVIIALIWIPKETKSWASRFTQTYPQEYSEMNEERRKFLKEFDDFVISSGTQDNKSIIQFVFSKQFKLNWKVLGDIKEEVENFSGKDVLKVWYVYNMGVIGKVNDAVVCFDLSTVVPTPQLLELSEVCDYLLLSHGDGDHFSPLIIKRVLENGGKTIIQDDTGMWDEIVKASVAEDLHGNIYNLEDRESLKVGEVGVFSLQTSHRGSAEKDNAWMYISVEGFNILHTGDGTLSDSKEWSEFGEIDLLLANTIIQPIDLRDSNARYIIPLHMHEIGHDKRFLEENSFNTYFTKLDSFDGDINSMIYPLVWGESIEVRK